MNPRGSHCVARNQNRGLAKTLFDSLPNSVVADVRSWISRPNRRRFRLLTSAATCFQKGAEGSQECAKTSLFQGFPGPFKFFSRLGFCAESAHEIDNQANHEN